MRNNFWPNISKDFKRKTRKTVKITYPKQDLPTKGKKTNQAYFASYTYLHTLILRVQGSAVLPYLGWGVSFLGPTLNIIFLIKALLHSQAILIITFDGSYCTLPDYHKTNVYYMS